MAGNLNAESSAAYASNVVVALPSSPALASVLLNAPLAATHMASNMAASPTPHLPPALQPVDACLQVLNLDFCTLANLPPSLGKLTALTTLDVEGNVYLGDSYRQPAPADEEEEEAAAQAEAFPEELCGLQGLQYLNLNSCGLTSVPLVRELISVVTVSLSALLLLPFYIPGLQKNIRNHKAGLLNTHEHQQAEACPTSHQRHRRQAAAVEVEVLCFRAGCHTDGNAISFGLHGLSASCAFMRQILCHGRH